MSLLLNVKSTERNHNLNNNMVYLLNSLETKRKKNSNKMWIKEKIHSSCDLYNLFLNYVISWNRITMTNHLIKLTKQSQLLSTSNKNEWNLNPPVYLQALFNKQSMDYDLRILILLVNWHFPGYVVIIWKIVSVTAVLYCGIQYLKTSERLH